MLRRIVASSVLVVLAGCSSSNHVDRMRMLSQQQGSQRGARLAIRYRGRAKSSRPIAVAETSPPPVTSESGLSLADKRPLSRDLSDQQVVAEAGPEKSVRQFTPRAAVAEAQSKPDDRRPNTRRESVLQMATQARLKIAQSKPTSDRGPKLVGPSSHSTSPADQAITDTRNLGAKPDGSQHAANMTAHHESSKSAGANSKVSLAIEERLEEIPYLDEENPAVPEACPEPEYDPDTGIRRTQSTRLELAELAGDETHPQVLPPSPMPAVGNGTEPLPLVFDDGLNLPGTRPLSISLASALRMIGGKHPAIGFAQWRVQEAYAQHERAEVLWLPSIQAGFSYHKHDGNLQASDGNIIDVNRGSLQYGLGAGAVGAGTTQRPGLVAQFHTADAVFQPSITQKNSWARGHAANAVCNQQLREVALAYVNLLTARQESQVIIESRQRTAELAQITSDFAAAGQGPQADADRLATEVKLVDTRLVRAQEDVDVASARLAEALSIDASQFLMPMEVSLIPIELIAIDMGRGAMIATGLSTRPELKEMQALVAMACEEYRRQRYAPLVPSVLLGLSPTGFGGGLGSTVGNMDGRVDFDAVVTWELRNLGLGERAARKEANARIEQAKYDRVRRMDQVAREVSEAHSQVLRRRQRIRVSESAIQTARDSYDRNLSRIRDGQGLPIEVLQSVQALEEAQRGYLLAVSEYNQAQFQLMWALGWPLQSGTPPQAPRSEAVKAASVK